MTDDEQLADMTDALERMVAAGDLELATRNDAAPLARALLDAIERRPELDVERWLVEHDAVVELFLDADELASRLAPVLARTTGRDPEPSWDEALAARIAEAPEDVAARVVFGDWLEQRGDPRGELIQIQARREAAPHDQELARREAFFIERWRGYLLGSLADDAQAKAVFRLGFVDRLEATVAAFHAERANPSLRFVRELRVTNDPARLLPLPATIESLAIATSSAGTLSIAELAGGLPRLRRLEVRGSTLALDAPLPGLRALVLHVDRLVAEQWRDRLPALEELELTRRSPPAELLAMPPATLRRLRVTSTDAVESVLGSALLAQLAVLDLSDARLDDAAPLLRASASKLAHLQLLDLRGSAPMADLQRLRELGPYVKGPRQRR